MTGKPRVLVSGFEGFGGAATNPSAMICEKLMELHFNADEHRYELAIVILPVSFADSYAHLESSIRSFKPDIVLCLGQAGGRRAIEFERVAVNMIDADIPDNNGKIYRETPISEGGPTAYLSRFPLHSLVNGLQAQCLEARISNSAGLYVCNFLFYKLMEFSQSQSLISGFAHLPYLPEQAEAAFSRHEVQAISTGGGDVSVGVLPHSMEFAPMFSAIQLTVEILAALTKH